MGKPVPTFGNPLAATTRILSAGIDQLSEQIRYDLRIGLQLDEVDVQKTPLNRILITPDLAHEVLAICEARRSQCPRIMPAAPLHVIAKTGVVKFGARAAELFAGLPITEQDAALGAVASGIAGRLNSSLHGMVVHLDHGLIHAHYVVAAIDRNGRSITDTISPRILSGLQDLTAEIMSGFCPEIARGRTWRVNVNLSQYKDNLEQVADRQAAVPAIVVKPSSYEDVLAHLQKMDTLDKVMAFDKMLCSRITKLEKAERMLVLRDVVPLDTDSMLDLMIKKDAIRKKISKVRLDIRTAKQKIAAGKAKPTARRAGVKPGAAALPVDVMGVLKLGEADRVKILVAPEAFEEPTIADEFIDAVMESFEVSAQPETIPENHQRSMAGAMLSKIKPFFHQWRKS